MDNQEKTYVIQKNNPGAYLNIDMKGLNLYKQNRNKILNKQDDGEINNLKQQVTTLQSEIQELKALLIKALESK